MNPAFTRLWMLSTVLAMAPGAQGSDLARAVGSTAAGSEVVMAGSMAWDPSAGVAGNGNGPAAAVEQPVGEPMTGRFCVLTGTRTGHRTERTARRVGGPERVIPEKGNGGKANSAGGPIDYNTQSGYPQSGYPQSGYPKAPKATYCSGGAGRSYTREDLDRTGAATTADALRLLDPSLR